MRVCVRAPGRTSYVAGRVMAKHCMKWPITATATAISNVRRKRCIMQRPSDVATRRRQWPYVR